MKSAHPVEYNARLETEDRRKKAQFSQNEMVAIIDEELQFTGRFVNQHLATLFNRPVNEIKNLRKGMPYSRMLDQVKASQPSVSIPITPQSGVIRALPNNPPSNEDALPDQHRLDASASPLSHALPLKYPSSPVGSLLSPDLFSPSTLSTCTPTDTLPPNPIHSSPNPITPYQNRSLLDVSSLSLLSNIPPLSSSFPSPFSTFYTPSSIYNSPLTPDLSIRSTISPPDPPFSFPNPDDQVLHYALELLQHESIPNSVRQPLQSIVSSDPCDDLLDRFISTTYTPPPRQPETVISKRPPPPAEASPNKKKRNGTDERRTYLFKRTQQLFAKDKALLTNKIINGLHLDEVLPSPPIEEVERAYSEIFGVDPGHDNHPIQPKPLEPGESLYRPILISEVSTAIKTHMSDAAGPDGIRLKHIKRIPERVTTIFFNLWLYKSTIPPSLRKCRTTLMPKPGADLKTVDGWRPITVSSLLYRIFARILAIRLRALPFHPAQRGFMEIDGTLANNFTLQALIKHCRTSSRPYSISTIDLRKAFDTVAHSSLARAMDRFNFHPKIKTLILSSFVNCTTVVSVTGQSTRPINISRGVRQGDPISPYLFNLVLDELLDDLYRLPTGIELGECRFPALAYADDLLLLSHSVADQQYLAKTCETFFYKRHLSPNPRKCSTLQVNLLPSKKKLYTASNVNIILAGQRLPVVKADDTFKYLDLPFSPLGITSPSQHSLELAIARLSKAALKPFQRLLILFQYVIPRFLYALQSPSISKKTLYSFDRLTRRAVKKWLHLPSQSPSAYLYASRKDGGLGLFHFSSRIPAILLNRLLKLEDREDHLFDPITKTDYFKKTKGSLSDLCGEYGLSHSSAAQRWKQKLHDCFSGNGIQQQAKGGSCWILDPPSAWSGRDYIRAIHLRGNLLPTKGGLHNRSDDRLCRGSCRRVESLSHVLQKCPATHFERIKRHDHCVSSLKKFYESKGWTTEIEPRIIDPSGKLRKPDLIFSSSVVIVDVGIHWEGPDKLLVTYNNKIATYSDPPMVEALKRRYAGCDITFKAYILGARGGWCPRNSELESMLGLGPRPRRFLISDVIKCFILIHEAFSRVVWEPQQPPRRRAH